MSKKGDIAAYFGGHDRIRPLHGREMGSESQPGKSEKNRVKSI